VRRAADAFEAYQREIAAGNFEAAGKQLEEARRLVRQAESLADGGSGSGETPDDPLPTEPTDTAPAEPVPTESGPAETEQAAAAAP
jgi:hypothetical protein